MRVLLTGATGYIGGRLLPRLEERGDRVRCLARRPQYLEPRTAPTTEVVAGDALDPGSLGDALDGVDRAFYLIHSMGEGDRFLELDRRAAENFAVAAREAGVGGIVYLGGLGREKRLSPHLESRQEVGRILRASGVPTVELRASIIIGSGSLSFEMVRALVNRLPVMITPRWVDVPAQPIAVEDVVEYLLAAAELEVEQSRIYEIGGADRVSYRGLMREYARQRGLRRIMVPVPVLTPGLSSLWLGLVTPVYARVGRKLVDSIRNETVVHDTSALRDFDIRPRGVAEAIRRALEHEDREFARTRWSDALSSKGAGPTWAGVRFGTRRIDSRTVVVEASPGEAFRAIRRLGGATGWYFADPLWRLRGFLDLLLGGVGMRRGRRHPDELVPGDTVDFWRVEEIEPGRTLRLAAEMRLPGRAWLQFEVEPVDGEALAAGRSRIRQTAIFDPVGVTGLLYWYLVYPVHALVFAGLLRGIARRVERPSIGRSRR